MVGVVVVVDDAIVYGYYKRVKVTPAVYPRCGLAKFDEKFSKSKMFQAANM
jgi:hypothetical protein